MSVYSMQTGLSSILKNYSSAERDKAKLGLINKVTFELPKGQSVAEMLESVLDSGNYGDYYKFTSTLKDGELKDEHLLHIISDIRKCVHMLKPQFSDLVETLLSINWINRSKSITTEYSKFYIDLLLAQNKYASSAISQLISKWIPGDDEQKQWLNGYPDESTAEILDVTHKLLSKLLYVIPMTHHIVLTKIEKLFPYYKRPPHVIGGYIHNVLWFLEYRPNATSNIIVLLLKKLLIMDVNAPREEIEDAECTDPDVEDDTQFHMGEVSEEAEDLIMHHSVAEALDVCMEKLFEFIEKKVFPEDMNSKRIMSCLGDTSLFNVLYTAFEEVVLPSHNTHHVQFLMFYLCSFKGLLVEEFLKNLWKKACNPNISAFIRQAAVSYIASSLARSKYLSMDLLKYYISEMCSWAHHYIQECDLMRSTSSLRANRVFFSICQAIFYVIAFRSRFLTEDRKGLLFLQSLQLSALVTSSLNPLRVCIPAVATAFAGVTRTYQLAYCHVILERNARRKLATVYSNEISTPEECLDTFFPFDPYLLKKSGKRIEPIYLQYQASESEEDPAYANDKIQETPQDHDVDDVDDVDDFIVYKKRKISESSKSFEKEMQFTYGLPLGFHT